MSKLNTLTTAINARLTAGLVALNNPVDGPLTTEITVLTEDAGDLETKIDKAINELGLLVLIGQPHFVNTELLANSANCKISLAVAVGENPTLWRDEADLKPHAVAVMEYVTQLLHQFRVTGFQNLRVLRSDFIPDKKRQMYEISLETMFLLPKIP